MVAPISARWLPYLRSCWKSGQRRAAPHPHSRATIRPTACPSVRPSVRLSVQRRRKQQRRRLAAVHGTGRPPSGAYYLGAEPSTDSGRAGGRPLQLQRRPTDRSTDRPTTNTQKGAGGRARGSNQLSGGSGTGATSLHCELDIKVKCKCFSRQIL